MHNKLQLQESKNRRSHHKEFSFSSQTLPLLCLLEHGEMFFCRFPSCPCAIRERGGDRADESPDECKGQRTYKGTLCPQSLLPTHQFVAWWWPLVTQIPTAADILPTDFFNAS